MFSITVNASQLNRLKKQLGEEAPKKIRREVATAINATSKKVRSEMSKEIRKELATTAKAVNVTLKVTRKATKDTLGATVRLSKTKRIPLRDFGARQNQKGVSYRISKTEGRKTVLGAFQGPKPGVMKASWRGNVFKRVGKSRLPIVKLMGASPWGVFVKRGMRPSIVRLAQLELNKQVERRIRFLNLKQSGAI